MAYDLENLKRNKGGATLETSDRPATPGGLYRHPETGVEIITLSDPLFGDAQSEGIVRAGFEYISEAPEGSIKTILDVAVEKAAATSTVEAELRAEIAALKAEKTAKKAVAKAPVKTKTIKEKKEVK